MPWPSCSLWLRLTLWSPCPASAQTPAEFYNGKTIELDISSTAGGGYDVHSRLLARHMPKYMPGNPTIVPKNVEGASGVRLANLLYNTAPHDGTVFGIIYRNTPFEPLFGNKAAQFDASQIHLDRQRQQRSLALRVVAHERHRDARRSAHARS